MTPLDSFPVPSEISEEHGGRVVTSEEAAQAVKVCHLALRAAKDAYFDTAGAARAFYRDADLRWQGAYDFTVEGAWQIRLTAERTAIDALRVVLGAMGEQS